MYILFLMIEDYDWFLFRNWVYVLGVYYFFEFYFLGFVFVFVFLKSLIVLEWIVLFGLLYVFIRVGVCGYCLCLYKFYCLCNFV